MTFIDRGATCFPMHLHDEGLALDGVGAQRRPNMSAAAQRYLDRLGLGVEDLFHHALAVLHDPAYREANAGALRMEWPRIPLPGWPDGDAPGRRRRAARLRRPGPGVGRAAGPGDAGGGGDRRGAAPGVGGHRRPIHRRRTEHDRRRLRGHRRLGPLRLGRRRDAGPGPRRGARLHRRRAGGYWARPAAFLANATVDVHLNDNARWSNVPAAVWNYKLGGYQVLKKWLSYRESKVLGRSLLPEEVQHFTDTARRIAAILKVTSGKSLAPFVG